MLLENGFRCAPAMKWYANIIIKQPATSPFFCGPLKLDFRAWNEMAKGCEVGIGRSQVENALKKEHSLFKPLNHQHLVFA